MKCQCSPECKKLVKSFKKQPFGIPYKFKGKSRTYYPDYYVLLKDGRELIFELKGQYTKRDKAKFKYAPPWCKDNEYEWVAIYEKPTKPLTQYIQ
jgi:hypothetical protein